MESKQLGGNIDLFGTEQEFLEELRNVEEENRDMTYDAETLLLYSGESSDIDLDDGDIESLASYMEDVRTQKGVFSEPHQQRNPLSYDLKEVENGVKASLFYDHPRGTVKSEITGEFSDSSSFKIDSTLNG